MISQTHLYNDSFQKGNQSSFGGSFFALFKAVLKVGAQAFFPFKRVFKRNMGELLGHLLGTITKEKGPFVLQDMI